MFASLKSHFPDDYFFVTIITNNLLPNNVPNWFPWRHMADGIGHHEQATVGTADICRYPMGAAL